MGTESPLRKTGTHFLEPLKLEFQSPKLCMSLFQNSSETMVDDVSL